MTIAIITFVIVWAILGFIAQAMFRAAVYSEPCYTKESADHFWREALLPNFLIPPAGILATLQTWGWHGFNWLGTWERE